MNALKHTPGPWEAVGDDSVRRPHVVRGAASRAIVAHTYWDSDLMDDVDEPDANAKLIAAAPALADALEAQRCFQCTADEPDEDVCDVCRLRRAALRAAGRLP